MKSDDQPRVRSAGTPVFDLASLIKRIVATNIHNEVQTGSPLGAEFWASEIAPNRKKGDDIG
jgi:hypothetical protein